MTTDKRPATDPVPPPRGKISEALLAGGTEPDARFTLANERTFLDWGIPALSAPITGQTTLIGISSVQLSSKEGGSS